MYSSGGGSEIIHISLGPRGNSVTSHLMNLYGLACTCSSKNINDNSIPLCDPYITHNVLEGTYVPRVLFVDGSDYSPSGLWSFKSDHSSIGRLSSWDGSLQFQNGLMMSTTNYNDKKIFSSMNNSNEYKPKKSKYSSRYKVSSHSSSLSSQYVFPTILEDDKRNYLECNNTEKGKLVYNHDEKKYTHNYFEKQDYEPQTNIYHTWNNSCSIMNMESNILSDQNYAMDGRTLRQFHERLRPKSSEENLLWPDYFLPPKPPDKNCSIPLEFKRGNTLLQNSFAEEANKLNLSDQNIFFNYNAGYNPSSLHYSPHGIGLLSKNWREEVLSEKIRKCIENCDCVQGFQLLIDGEMALFGGLSQSILEELSEECAKVTKWSILIEDDAFNSNHKNSLSYQPTGYNSKQSFLSDLNKGLTLQAITTNSDLVLPISLLNCLKTLHFSNRQEHYDSSLSMDTVNNFLFNSSAVAALSLEVSTLPFRLIKNFSEHQVKFSTNIEYLNNTFLHSTQYSQTNEPYSCTDRLTYNELTSYLNPSHAHSILELSTMLQSRKFTNKSSLVAENLYHKLSEGTSIRQRKVKLEAKIDSFHRNRKNSHILPGSWMEDKGSSGGILFPLSHLNISKNKSLHKHFSMSTSFRPSKIDVMNESEKDITKMIMEGMSIRYKPKSCVVTYVNQSFSDLVGDEISGTEIYWDKLLEKNNIGSESSIISVISNSTRTHSYLRLVGKKFQNCLKRKNKSIMNHHIMAGASPGIEENLDTLERCIYLRELYRPPFCTDDSAEEDYFDVDE